MSIIVVVKKNGKVVIAADTHYSFGNLIVRSEYLSNRTKIHQFDDSFIGTVGATAHENVLEHLFEKHKSKLAFGNKKDIFNTYLRLHPILKNEYFLNTSQGEDDEDYESSQIDALIANSNGIFGIYSWREVYEFEKFWALGSGRDYALGSLFTNYDLLGDAEQIAETAVQAACEFDEGCGLPLTFHSILLKKEEPVTKNKAKKRSQK